MTEEPLELSVLPKKAEVEIICKYHLKKNSKITLKHLCQKIQMK